MSNIDAINSVWQAPTKPAAAPTNSLGKDAFLKLLVAQLKYQNPLSPTDPTEFMSQTAQFTMVEKMEDLANQNKVLMNNQASATATSLIGQKITALGADGNDITGVVSGVRFSVDGPVLKIGNLDVPMASVKEVTRS